MTLTRKVRLSIAGLAGGMTVVTVLIGAVFGIYRVRALAREALAVEAAGIANAVGQWSRTVGGPSGVPTANLPPGRTEFDRVLAESGELDGVLARHWQGYTATVLGPGDSAAAGSALPSGLDVQSVDVGRFVSREDAAGIDRVVFRAAVPGMTWHVVMTAPLATVYAGARPLYWLAALTILVALAIAFAFSSYLAGHLSVQFREIGQAISAIGRGEFGRRVPETGDDELRDLASVINGLAASLEQSLGQIETAAQAVAASSQQILSAAEQQQQATAQQSASLHQTASTVEELDLSARQAAANAKEVVARTEKASRQILALSEKALRVSKASDVIDEVSRQIRILALNASIEAARSETNGGGFSVIASEIRRLADDTRKSTGEIDVLVQDMQEATSSSVMMMEQTVESVKVIGLAMSQQSVATAQITEAMTEMNASMRQAVTTTESTVQSGEELNRLALSLQETIARIRHVALPIEAATSVETEPVPASGA